MKGIMRKRLLSLLSVVGLASSATPASPQAPTGATQADTKSESTMKRSKTVQEDAASKDAAKMTKAETERKAGGSQQEYKHKVSSAEGGHATSDIIPTRQRKAGGETSVQDVHIKKAVKSTAEANAVQTGIQDKRKKSAAGANAAESEKVNKASPK
jgi:hypothetical protein